MHWLAVQRTLGILLVLFSTTMLPPLAVSLYYDDGNWRPFVISCVGIAAVGAVSWWPARSSHRELHVRDGFLIVSLFWIVLSGAGAVPFLLSDAPAMTVSDAVFEAVSGFTTTGATVLTGLDLMVPSFLYYRQQIHWFGGMGIVVLAVAIVPMLRVGGMQLMKAETPGPVKDARLTPRITETAKALWLVYVSLTALCAASFWIAGMSLFDAIGHAFSTLSTGGFSTHDLSLAFYDSAAIETIAMVFMFLGGASFALHFLAWRDRSGMDYLRDPEFRAYAGALGGLILLYTVALYAFGEKDSALAALRASAFQAISIQTSTGFLTEDFSMWPFALPVMLIFSTFLGGCAGSTAGGMKVIRWVIMWKQVSREFKRLVHPSAVVPLKLGARTVEERIVSAIRGFFTLYLVVFLVLMLALVSTGADVITAFSAIATCMNNTGPGLGDVVWSFSTVTVAGKWICTLAMLLGRLEIFPLLVIASPAFWRQ
jgi:trk system potassium uptake protein TrkH